VAKAGEEQDEVSPDESPTRPSRRSCALWQCAYRGYVKLFN
jgi:hypothetical protein